MKRSSSFISSGSILFFLFLVCSEGLYAQCSSGVQVWADDFDGGIDGAAWVNNTGLSNTTCGSVAGDACYFEDASTRVAETPDLDVSGGGTVEFHIVFGDGGSPCEDAETGEDVVLEYSTDGGGTWNLINTYTTPTTTWTSISENIPAGAQTASTRFRWRQVSFTSSTFYDHWAIDEAQICEQNNTCTGGNDLSSSYNSNNGQDGIMFDITNTASQEITIECFTSNFDAGTYDVEVYYKSGTHVGSENNSGAWSLAATANGVSSSGVDNPTLIPAKVGVTIPCGETYGFYVTTTDGTFSGMNYTNGTAVGNVLASDANMELLEGTGKGYPFNTNYTPREFNGSVNYSLGSKCVSGCDSLSEAFSSSWPSGWSRSSSSEAEVNNTCNGSNSYALQVNGENSAWVETPVLDVSNATQVDISYIYRQGDNSNCGNNPESGDNIDVEYWDGGAWVNLANYDGGSAPNSFTSESFTITSGLTANFQLRFDMVSGSGAFYDNFNFDDVKIKATCGGGTCLHITECDTEWNSGDDFVEIQNTGGSNFDASGWVVAISDDYTDINQVNPDEWNLGVINAGQVLYRTDNSGDNYWGSNIFWRNGDPGWALLLDDNGKVRDYVAWDWTSTDVQNMSTTINGFSNVSGGSGWSGGTLPMDDNHQREGPTDNNDASDWASGPTSGHSKGTQNSNLSVPFSSCAPLPVEMLSFDGSCKGGRTVLEWRTASESNNRKYVIERSTDGHDYEKVGEVSGNGTTSRESSYTWKGSESLNGLAYYRLKQVDFNGRSETHGPIALKACAEEQGGLKVLDNGSPAPRLRIHNLKDRGHRIRIMDPRGKEVHRFRTASFQGARTFDMPSSLSSGVYFVRSFAGEERTVKKVLIRD